MQRALWCINTGRNLNATCKYQMTFTKHVPCLILLWANVVITDFILSNKITFENKAARKISIRRGKSQRITETITYSDKVQRVDSAKYWLTDPFSPKEWLWGVGTCVEKISLFSFVSISVFISVYVTIYPYTYLIWASVWHIEYSVALKNWEYQLWGIASL